MDIEIELEHYNAFLRDMEDLNVYEMFIMNGEVQQIPTNFHRITRRRFNPLIDLTEEVFREKYRFSKDNIRRIIELLRDDLEVDQVHSHRANQVPVELQIMAAIRFWGSTEHPEMTAMAHSISGHTLSKICRLVAAALASKASRYIRMPATLAEKERVTNAFQELSGMPQVIGAIAHTTVQIRRNYFERERRNGMNSNDNQMTIQIVCDATLKIRDIDCKLQTFRHLNYASEMFSHSRIKERLEQNEFRGRLILGDEYLSCASYLFTPVQCPTTLEEQAFNRSHATTMAPATKCINMLRKRFGIIGSEICASQEVCRYTIIALALLHNMAVEWNDPCLDHDSNGFVSDDDIHESTISTVMPVNIDTHARLEFIKNHFIN